jgi:phosphoglycerate dehydrogenase-like enzyme
MTFAFMLGLARRLYEADGLWRKGRWAKNELAGYNLAGKTLGIVGCGNIGTRVGQLGTAWGMRVLGCVEHTSPKVAAQLARHNIVLKSFHEILPEADFLSLHVPLKNSTRNLININTLAQMKNGSYLINLARGGVVHESDLLQALQAGKLGGAALDVHEKEGEGKISPLAQLPNVLLTPHIGAMTVDSQREIGRLVIQTLDRFQAEDEAFTREEHLVL